MWNKDNKVEEVYVADENNIKDTADVKEASASTSCAEVKMDAKASVEEAEHELAAMDMTEKMGNDLIIENSFHGQLIGLKGKDNEKIYEDGQHRHPEGHLCHEQQPSLPPASGGRQEEVVDEEHDGDVPHQGRAQVQRRQEELRDRPQGRGQAQCRDPGPGGDQTRLPGGGPTGDVEKAVKLLMEMSEEKQLNEIIKTDHDYAMSLVTDEVSREAKEPMNCLEGVGVTKDRDLIKADHDYARSAEENGIKADYAKVLGSAVKSILHDGMSNIHSVVF